MTCVEDESMNQWLKVINAKLDYLISQFLAKREAIVMTIEPLNISINGMSIIVQDKSRFDDLLKIRIVLSIAPPEVLHLYGEVVRSDLQPNYPERYEVGINFIGITGEVEDELKKLYVVNSRKVAGEK